jgi:hypothetical protein
MKESFHDLLRSKRVRARCLIYYIFTKDAIHEASLDAAFLWGSADPSEPAGASTSLAPTVL